LQLELLILANKASKRVKHWYKDLFGMVFHSQANSRMNFHV